MSSTWRGGDWGNAGDEEDDENEVFTGYSATKDQLILLIDCTKKMFQPHGDVIPFELCIKCAKSVLLNKIVSSDKDIVGVVFFGTDKDKNQNDFKNVYVFQDIETPDASRIKALEEILTTDNFGDFSTQYGHSDAFSLSDVLWTCSSLMAKSGSKNSQNRILLFTATDHPHVTNPSLQDLADNGIEIELMHIGSSFDVSLFYQDIIFTGDDDVVLPNPAEKFEELLIRVRSKEFKKRAVQRMTLNLGSGIELGVGVYCLVREAKKPSFVKLDKRTNEELKTHTKLLCNDTATELMPQDIKYYQDFGGQKVIFEKEETAQIKKIGDKGLTLIGFKPASRCKKYYYIKPASFIYPDEKEVTGSTKLFSALLLKCLERDVVAICQFTPTVSAAPRFVALLPQTEVLDNNNVQLSPPGFHVIFLPFVEELRKLDVGEVTKADTPEIDKAKEIIKKLTFNYQSDAFENPVLQTHYKYLEAIALEHEEVEPITDLTVPDQDMISRRAGSLLDEFKEIVYPPGYDPEKTGTKRKAASGATASRAKIPKTEDGGYDIPALAKDGKLSSLKVADLKEYLKSIGLRTTGKKQELIDSITSHFEP